MEDRAFEKLFKDGLNKQGDFSNVEIQWKTVEGKLKTKGSRRLLMLVVFGLMIFGIGFSSILTCWFVASNEDGFISNSEEIIINDVVDLEVLDILAGNDNIELKVNVNPTRDLIKRENSTTVIESELLQKSNSNSIQKELNNSVDVVERNTFDDNLNNINSLSKLKEEEQCIPCEDEDHIVAKEIKTISKHENKSTKEYSDSREVNRNIELVLLESLVLDLISKERSIPESGILNKVIKTLDVKTSAMSFQIGMSLDRLSDDQIIINESVRPFLGLAYLHRSGFGVKLKYNWGNINRVLLGSTAEYQIPLVSYEPTIPDSTRIDFGNRSLDISVSKNLISYKNFTVGLLGGIQMNDYFDSKVDYIYNGVYQVNVVSVSLVDKNMEITDLNMGTHVTYRLLPRLNIEGHYQYHIPIGDNYQWNNRHRFFLGLNYTILNK